MTNYDQHIKHWKNHGKDKYFQQCSGYYVTGKSEQATDEQIHSLTISCFEKIVKEVKAESFPIYIRIHGDGYISICDSNDLFGNKINNYDELIKFGEDYILDTKVTLP